MCVVVQHILARRPAARPRCIPPAIGSSRALNPFQSQQNVSTFNHSKGLGALPLHPSPEPCTKRWPFDHQSGELSSSLRYPHDHFMEMISSRAKGVPALVQSVTRKGAFHSCPCLGTIPSTKGRFAAPGPTSRAWRYASPPAPNHAQTSGRLITTRANGAMDPTPWLRP